MRGFATFDATPDLAGTVKAERISFQIMATSAKTTDSARQDQMIALAILTPRASHRVTPKTKRPTMKTRAMA
jgi:hypothetical protein